MAFPFVCAYLGAAMLSMDHTNLLQLLAVTHDHVSCYMPADLQGQQNRQADFTHQAYMQLTKAWKLYDSVLCCQAL